MAAPWFEPEPPRIAWWHGQRLKSIEESTLSNRFGRSICLEKRVRTICASRGNWGGDKEFGRMRCRQTDRQANESMNGCYMTVQIICAGFFFFKFLSFVSPRAYLVSIYFYLPPLLIISFAWVGRCVCVFCGAGGFIFFSFFLCSNS